MEYFLFTLNSIIEPGIELTRNEVIRRYRLMAECKVNFLQLLCMTQFNKLVKDEKGQLFLV